MLNYNKRKGDYGESVADGYLAAKGYEITARKYKKGGGEIDIIARDKECTVFIEVKYRKTLSAGLPREAVTYTKQQAIRRAAQYYIMENGLHENELRFDVVEIIGTELLQIEHIINAF